jgi:predicted ArsR family transcriptional regulator
MNTITNAATPTDEVGAVNRAQIEHRATWMGLIYDEMVKAGIDAEPIIRRAVARCGQAMGAALKARCPDGGDLRDFGKAFLTDLSLKTFAMEPTVDADNLRVTFHYCPLMTAWEKLGFDQKTCELLCDMAMDGDRNIAQVMGLQFDLGETIAEGCGHCELHFHR